MQGKAIGDYRLSLLPSITAPVKKATISRTNGTFGNFSLKIEKIALVLVGWCIKQNVSRSREVSGGEVT